jgi:hypothetical protein
MDEGAETCMKLLPNLWPPAFLLDCLQESHHLRFCPLVTFFVLPRLSEGEGFQVDVIAMSHTVLLQPHSLSFLAPLLCVAEVVQ